MTSYGHCYATTAHYHTINLYTVPDMPSKLSAEVVNGSLIVVKWEPPLNENGILLGYQVTYQGEQVSVANPTL